MKSVPRIFRLGSALGAAALALGACAPKNFDMQGKDAEQPLTLAPGESKTVTYEAIPFGTGTLTLEGGIAVTASHNPKEYTGMKIVRRGALPVGDRQLEGEVAGRGQLDGQFLAVAKLPVAGLQFRRFRLLGAFLGHQPCPSSLLSNSGEIISLIA